MPASANAYVIKASMQFSLSTASIKPVIDSLEKGLAGRSINLPLNIVVNKNVSAQLEKQSSAFSSLAKAIRSVDSASKKASTSLLGLSDALGAIKSNFAGMNTSINAFGSATNKLGKANQAAQELNGTMEKGARLGDTFASSIGVSARRFSTFVIAASAISGLVLQIGDAIKQALAFDQELVRLKQVSGDTAGSIKSISDTVTKLSTSLGVSSADLIKTATTLKQAGFSAGDTKIALDALAKTTLSPTFDGLDNTTEGLIAIFSQFKQGAGSLEAQLGSLSKVSADYAVESSDLVEAVKRSGAAFAGAGGSLNELFAIFTSIRSTTRESAESIATGLRTIIARLQDPKISQGLHNIGVDLYDLNNNFVGPFEAAKRLHDALVNIDPKNKAFAGILKELGGLRNLSRSLPLVTEFPKAQEALVSANSGKNSLSKDALIAQEAFLNSIVKLKEGFLELFRIISSDSAVRAFADGTVKAITGINSALKELKGLIPALLVLGSIKIGANLFATRGEFARGFKNPKGYAVGGMIEDRVPVMLTPGEGVLSPKATKAIGYHNIARWNKRPETFSVGGIVPNAPRSGVSIGTDTVPAMLPPGTSIVNKRAMKVIGEDNIHQWNAAAGYAGGGLIPRKLEISRKQTKRDLLARMIKSPGGKEVYHSMLKDSKYIGSGLEGMAFRTPEGDVVRVADNGSKRPVDRYMLQPTETVEFGKEYTKSSGSNFLGQAKLYKKKPYIAEKLPFAPSLKNSIEDPRRRYKVASAFRSRLHVEGKYNVVDAHDDNIGRIKKPGKIGKIVAIDPGTYSLQNGEEGLPSYAAGGKIEKLRATIGAFFQSKNPATPIARSIYDYSSKIQHSKFDALAASEYGEQIFSHVPEKAKLIGHGAFAQAFKHENTVFRIAPPPQANSGTNGPRPKDKYTLQALKTHNYPNAIVEELPFAPPISQTVQSKSRQHKIINGFSQRMDKEGFYTTDLSPENLAVVRTPSKVNPSRTKLSVLSIDPSVKLPKSLLTDANVGRSSYAGGGLVPKTGQNSYDRGKVLRLLKSRDGKAIYKDIRRSKLAGVGASAIAFRTPEDTILRVEKNHYGLGDYGDGIKRPKDRLMLQPISSKRVGDTLIEELPFVPPLKQTHAIGSKRVEKILDGFTKRIEDRGFSPVDPHSGNVGIQRIPSLVRPGKFKKRVIAIDPGTYEHPDALANTPFESFASGGRVYDPGVKSLLDSREGSGKIPNTSTVINRYLRDQRHQSRAVDANFKKLLRSDSGPAIAAIIPKTAKFLARGTTAVVYKDEAKDTVFRIGDLGKRNTAPRPLHKSILQPLSSSVVAGHTVEELPYVPDLKNRGFSRAKQDKYVNAFKKRVFSRGEIPTDVTPGNLGIVNNKLIGIDPDISRKPKDLKEFKRVYLSHSSIFDTDQHLAYGGLVPKKGFLFDGGGGGEMPEDLARSLMSFERYRGRKIDQEGYRGIGKSELREIARIHKDGGSYTSKAFGEIYFAPDKRKAERYGRLNVEENGGGYLLGLKVPKEAVNTDPMNTIDTMNPIGRHGTASEIKANYITSLTNLRTNKSIDVKKFSERYNRFINRKQPWWKNAKPYAEGGRVEPRKSIGDRKTRNLQSYASGGIIKPYRSISNRNLDVLQKEIDIRNIPVKAKDYVKKVYLTKNPVKHYKSAIIAGYYVPKSRAIISQQKDSILTHEFGHAFDDHGFVSNSGVDNSLHNSISKTYLYKFKDKYLDGERIRDSITHEGFAEAIAYHAEEKNKGYGRKGFSLHNKKNEDLLGLIDKAYTERRPEFDFHPKIIRHTEDRKFLANILKDNRKRKNLVVSPQLIRGYAEGGEIEKYKYPIQTYRSNPDSALVNKNISPSNPGYLQQLLDQAGIPVKTSKFVQKVYLAKKPIAIDTKGTMASGAYERYSRTIISQKDPRTIFHQLGHALNHVGNRYKHRFATEDPTHLHSDIAQEYESSFGQQFLHGEPIEGTANVIKKKQFAEAVALHGINKLSPRGISRNPAHKKLLKLVDKAYKTSVGRGGPSIFVRGIEPRDDLANLLKFNRKIKPFAEGGIVKPYKSISNRNLDVLQKKLNVHKIPANAKDYVKKLYFVKRNVLEPDTVSSGFYHPGERTIITRPTNKIVPHEFGHGFDNNGKIFKSDHSNHLHNEIATKYIEKFGKHYMKGDQFQGIDSREAFAESINYHAKEKGMGYGRKIFAFHDRRHEDLLNLVDEAYASATPPLKGQSLRNTSSRRFLADVLKRNRKASNLVTAPQLIRGYTQGDSVRDSRDVVPAWLEPGEFVVPKQAVKRIGVNNLRGLVKKAKVGILGAALGGFHGLIQGGTSSGVMGAASGFLSHFKGAKGYAEGDLVGPDSKGRYRRKGKFVSKAEVLKIQAEAAAVKYKNLLSDKPTFGITSTFSSKSPDINQSVPGLGLPAAYQNAPLASLGHKPFIGGRSPLALPAPIPKLGSFENPIDVPVNVLKSPLPENYAKIPYVAGPPRPPLKALPAPTRALPSSSPLKQLTVSPHGFDFYKAPAPLSKRDYRTLNSLPRNNKQRVLDLFAGQRHIEERKELPRNDKYDPRRKSIARQFRQAREELGITKSTSDRYLDSSFKPGTTRNEARIAAQQTNIPLLNTPTVGNVSTLRVGRAQARHLKTARQQVAANNAIPYDYANPADNVYDLANDKAKKRYTAKDYVNKGTRYIETDAVKPRSVQEREFYQAEPRVKAAKAKAKKAPIQEAIAHFATPIEPPANIESRVSSSGSKRSLLSNYLDQRSNLRDPGSRQSSIGFGKTVITPKGDRFQSYLDRKRFANYFGSAPSDLSSNRGASKVIGGRPSSIGFGKEIPLKQTIGATFSVGVDIKKSQDAVKKSSSAFSAFFKTASKSVEDTAKVAQVAASQAGEASQGLKKSRFGGKIGLATSLLVASAAIPVAHQYFNSDSGGKGKTPESSPAVSALSGGLAGASTGLFLATSNPIVGGALAVGGGLVGAYQGASQANQENKQNSLNDKLTKFEENASHVFLDQYGNIPKSLKPGVSHNIESLLPSTKELREKEQDALGGVGAYYANKTRGLINYLLPKDRQLGYVGSSSVIRSKNPKALLNLYGGEDEKRAASKNISDLIIAQKQARPSANNEQLFKSTPGVSKNGVSYSSKELVGLVSGNIEKLEQQLKAIEENAIITRRLSAIENEAVSAYLFTIDELNEFSERLHHAGETFGRNVTYSKQLAGAVQGNLIASPTQLTLGDVSPKGSTGEKLHSFAQAGGGYDQAKKTIASIIDTIHEQSSTADTAQVSSQASAEFRKSGAGGAYNERITSAFRNTLTPENITKIHQGGGKEVLEKSLEQVKPFKEAHEQNTALLNQVYGQHKTEQLSLLSQGQAIDIKRADLEKEQQNIYGENRSNLNPQIRQVQRFAFAVNNDINTQTRTRHPLNIQLPREDEERDVRERLIFQTAARPVINKHLLGPGLEAFSNLDASGLGQAIGRGQTQLAKLQAKEASATGPAKLDIGRQIATLQGQLARLGHTMEDVAKDSSKLDAAQKIFEIRRQKLSEDTETRKGIARSLTFGSNQDRAEFFQKEQLVNQAASISPQQFQNLPDQVRATVGEHLANTQGLVRSVPVFGKAGKPILDQNGKQLLDKKGRPRFEQEGQQAFDIIGIGRRKPRKVGEVGPQFKYAVRIPRTEKLTGKQIEDQLTAPQLANVANKSAQEQLLNNAVEAFAKIQADALDKGNKQRELLNIQSANITEQSVKITANFQSFIENMGKSVTEQMKAANLFLEGSAKLTEALNSFPKTLQIERNGKIEVILNGAEVLTAIKGDLESTIWKDIKDVIDVEVKRQLDARPAQ